MKPSPVDAYLQRRQASRPYLILILILVVVFAVIVFRLVAAFEGRMHLFIVNEDTMMLSRETPFDEAGEFHVGQAERAAMAMLNRGPTGLAQERELKRLLDGPSLQKIQARTDAQTPEFMAKDTRQIIEISETKIQKKSGRVVEAKVSGQLLQYGIFDGRPTMEVHTLEIWMRLVYNPSLVEGGRYPLIVGDFEITTELVPSR